MPKEFATLIAALIGAISGSVFGPIVKDLLATRQTRTRRQQRIAQLYLTQLQDAVDSLCYRFDNLADRGGWQVMDESYRVVSTLYAWACVTAYRRILRLDGVYAQLESIGKKELATRLREDFRKIDETLKDDELQFYHRLTLAESVIVKERGQLRTSTFLEFSRQYGENIFHDSLEPARRYLSRLQGTNPKMLSGAIDLLVEMEKHISEGTREPTQLDRLRCQEPGPVQ